MITASERGSWGDLAARLRPYVARRVNGAAVDDVLQEVLLKMVRGLPQLGDDSRFGPWIYSIAKNAIADHGRKVARDRALSAVEVVSEDDDVEQRGIEERLSAYVAGLVSELASPYREAITLTELEGMTQAAAAAAVGISLSGMKSRVQRGRSQLLKKLHDCCAIELDARGRVLSCEPRSKDPSCDC